MRLHTTRSWGGGRRQNRSRVDDDIYVVRRGDESEVAEAKCSGVDGLLQLYELRRIIR